MSVHAQLHHQVDSVHVVVLQIVKGDDVIFAKVSSRMEVLAISQSTNISTVISLHSFFNHWISTVSKVFQSQTSQKSNFFVFNSVSIQFQLSVNQVSISYI
jgi:hypothetical protein